MDRMVGPIMGCAGGGGGCSGRMGRSTDLGGGGGGGGGESGVDRMVGGRTVAYGFDPWTTAIIDAAGRYMSLPMRVTRVGFDLAVFAALWLYGKLVLEPLRIFYFMGPVLENRNPEDICAQISKITASEFTGTEAGREMCRNLLERRFESYNATVITVLYFAILAIAVIYALRRCFFLPDVWRAARGCAGRVLRLVIRRGGGEACGSGSTHPT